MFLKNDHYPLVDNGVSVIIPTYNEKYDDLKKCLMSVVNAKGIKEIILVDNNNTSEEIVNGLNILREEFSGLVNFVFEKKQGKRYAHAKGLSVAKYDIVVFIDSDTVIHNDSLLEIQRPFFDDKIGGVSGQVKLLNKNDSWFTKSIDAMFWSSNNIFRRYSGVNGFMQVSPGALSAYRKKLLLLLEKGYLTQTFMGRKCSISDDRYLTMRVQTYFGKKVIYQPSAIAYTIMPDSFKGFWKVLERWKRGVLREILVFWKEPKQKAKLLFFDTQFNFLMTNILFFFKILLVIDLIFNFSFIHLLSVIFWMFLMTIFYNGLMLVDNPKSFKYKILYSFIYEFFLSFTYINALFNLRDQGLWKTR